MRVTRCDKRNCKNNKNGFCTLEVVYISEDGVCKDKKQS
ncbi:hypothetical protein SAMN02194393_03466 [Maledivibacter halophilus]|uniref:DUF1540 domain-containing protein n=1 Tax=Maledivibacter halophilus TaxID=36842 RepID=A0A1T5LWD5_9FIRM|nr:hypothetical protein SAMN02194393_02155 [Maledivibacter halophilus]SKC71613.1 hypothetical protein SAMN02194393_02497 [Maledivibacter halophilus]SKC80252.1 hypothetical protein SAMN02194393_03466 [Maledivibacter halophilus]